MDDDEDRATPPCESRSSPTHTTPVLCRAAAAALDNLSAVDVLPLHAAVAEIMSDEAGDAENLGCSPQKNVIACCGPFTHACRILEGSTAYFT